MDPIRLVAELYTLFLEEGRPISITRVIAWAEARNGQPLTMTREGIVKWMKRNGMPIRKVGRRAVEETLGRGALLESLRRIRKKESSVVSEARRLGISRQSIRRASARLRGLV